MVIWHPIGEEIKLEAHHTRHEKRGADEISIEGLPGVPAEVLAITDIDDEPVSGATTSPISSRWAHGHEEDQEALDFITSRVVKSILTSLWRDVDWDSMDLWDIDWEEWIEPVLRSGEASDPFDWNSQNLTGVGTITGQTAQWWHEYILPASAFSQGASGATTQSPNANTLGGWLLDRDVALEELNSTSHMEDDWDGASDPICELYFEVNVDNTGGNDTDTVDIQVIFRYKGDGETAIKTQTVTDTAVVGKSAQYKQFKAKTTLNRGLANNVLGAKDVVSIALGLVAASSEVTNIILNFGEFKYKTKKPAPEV